MALTKTTTRYKKLCNIRRTKCKGRWESCTGNKNGNNCWSPWSTDYDGDALKVKLTSNMYTKAAFEVKIDCEKTDIMKLSYDKRDSANTALKITYNGQQYSNWGYWKPNYMLKIPVKSSDANPVLRVEVSRERRSSSVIFIGRLLMQCTSGNCGAFADCVDMKSGTSSTAAMVKQAFGIPGLIQLHKGAAPSRISLGQQNYSRASATVQGLVSPGCADNCFAPPTAFKCPCELPAVLAATVAIKAATTVEEVKDVACKHESTCCTWKQSNCGQEDIAKCQCLQGQMMQKSTQEEMQSEEIMSLDDSVAGKRTCM